MRNMKTKDLVLMALYIALFAVLEKVTMTFPLFKMASGGRLSLSIIPLMIASYHLGVGKASVVALISVGLKLVMKAPYVVHPVQFLFDYPIAYMVYALAVKFKDVKAKEMSLPIGVLVANILRFMSHNIAGWVFFADGYPGNVFWGVMGYNATYMIPTLIISFVVVMLVKPRIESQFN